MLDNSAGTVAMRMFRKANTKVVEVQSINTAQNFPPLNRMKQFNCIVY